ncbi:MAG: mannosyltransferase [Solirubrobacteraceae bacterium]|jgi:4-amino-4-deoxy-L-arabinose transferase-like glycosyltransferase|nr:mannosyltransferase [Solirubrobacteraceae bacterium]
MNVPATQTTTPARTGRLPGTTGSAGAADRRWPAWTVPAVVGLLTVVGAILRLEVAHQSLFADELSTYWIIRDHGLRGVVSTVHSDAEITPPLYFVLAWATTVFGHAPELVRGPSLIAGIASIPLMYRLALRTIGPRAALIAAALTAVAPFPLYYSTEARAYGLMMALVIGSTLALLTAVDTRRARWWVVYAICSCAAVYAHYTCVFVLATQAVWVLWAHPEARRPALLANLAAALAFAPWVSGLLADFNSPTTKILSALAPFTFHDVRFSFEHWSVGYPIPTPLALTEFPGGIALVLLAVALLLGGVGVVTRVRAGSIRFAPASVDRRLLLIVALALAVPVGTVVVTIVGTNLVTVRNLAASWPAMTLVLAALLAAPPPRLRLVAGGLAFVAFAIGAGKLLTDRYQRPDAQGAADLVKREAGPRGVVIDETALLSPGPLSSLDASLSGPRFTVIRSQAPAERDHPFTIFDAVMSRADAFAQASRAAGDGRIWVVGTRFPRSALLRLGTAKLEAARKAGAPAGYRLVRRNVFPGILETEVTEYVRR